MHRIVFLFLIGLGTAGSPIGGQDPPVRVRVGDGTVDASFLQPYRSRFSLIRRAADGTESPHGAWTDRLGFVTSEGRRLLRRDVSRFTAEGTLDLERYHLVEPGTLSPVETRQQMGPGLGGLVTLDFAGNSVRAAVRASADAPTQEVTFTLSEPVYDLSLWAILLVAFPLAEGYAAEFPTLGQTGVLEWERLQVEGHEEVEVEGGRMVEAWIVSTTIRTWTAWLTRDPPYIARVEQRFADGSVVVSTRTGASVP